MLAVWLLAAVYVYVGSSAMNAVVETMLSSVPQSYYVRAATGAAIVSNTENFSCNGECSIWPAECCSR